MNIIARTEASDIATVFIGETSGGKQIEFVESVQPPFSRGEKWVLIISTLYGCPVGCRFCDAGGHFEGAVSCRDMLAQIDAMVGFRFPGRPLEVDKFKIQFARMGEPALNDGVLETLEILPCRYPLPGLLPTVSTIAPAKRERFFQELLAIRHRHYPERFQLQFSIHTTDESLRRWIIPAATWSLGEIAAYGADFHLPGGRKVTLNFALSEESPLDVDLLSRLFSPDIFMVKITPVNPTATARKHRIVSLVGEGENRFPVIEELTAAGYDVILSIGEREENLIGSNCGQYIRGYRRSGCRIEGGYTYRLTAVQDAGTA
ncbi:radical SAM protein [bacterium]|nr:radical SAM protein [bacterium]